MVYAHGVGYNQLNGMALMYAPPQAKKSLILPVILLFVFLPAGLGLLIHTIRYNNRINPTRMSMQEWQSSFLCRACGQVFIP
jgi:hypothetical protein